MILTEIRLIPTGSAQAAFGRLRSHDERYGFVAKYLESLLTAGRNLRLLIADAEPVSRSFVVPDVEYAGWTEVLVVVRRMGCDTGTDTLFNAESHLSLAVEHTLNTLRRSDD